MTIILWLNILKAQHRIPAKMVVQILVKKKNISVILMNLMKMILYINLIRIFKTAFIKKISKIH
jgi:hypothetical protein